MLSKSDTDIVSIVKLFSKYEIRCAFLVPTETGIKKSIMDAASKHDFDSAQYEGVFFLD